MICRKNKVNVTIASNGDHTDFGFGPNRPVCQNPECQAEMRERMVKNNEQMAKKQAEKILEKIQQQMDRGEKITIDFESYAIDEEKKKLIRKYQKSCQNIEDLKKQKENTLRCQNCQQIPNDGKYYEVGSEGNYCNNCAKKVASSNKQTELEKCDDCGKKITGKSYYQNWDGTNGSGISCESCNNSKKDNSRNNNYSPNSSTDKNPCQECNLLSVDGKYYTIGKKGHYCNSCADKLLEKDNSSSNDKTQNSPLRKIKLLAPDLKYGKKLIDQGRSPSEIDTSL